MLLRSVAVWTLIALVPPGAVLGAPPSPLEELQRPVALVNGIPIYPYDLDCALEASRAKKISDPESISPDSDLTLNRLIEIELLYQESLKHRFPGLNEEAEQRYRREVRRIGGEEKLRSYLKCNNLTPAQLRKSIFRTLSINRYLDKMVYSKITVTETEIQDYYQKHLDSFMRPPSVRLKQIIILGPKAPAKEDWARTADRARSVYLEAVRGADFETLARRHSEDPSGASLGGEMGVIYMGNLHRSFETLIFSMNAGSVTEPIRSNSGYHIIKIVSSSGPSQRPLEEVRNEIITGIRLSKASSRISELLSDLKESSDVRILND
ncbi:MAG: peptidylprolyl isomerase [bacterium]|nr:MAG: peptidylprolyl isomerase [bacterium]